MLKQKAREFAFVLAVTMFIGSSFADDTSIKLIDPNASTSQSESVERDSLLKLVDRAIDTTSRRYLTAGRHTPWQILHGVLAMRQDFQVKHVDTGEKISALKWVQDGPIFKGKSLLLKTNTGAQFHPYTEPYDFQGHPCQFLAILTMSQLPMNTEFKTQEGAITVQDLVNTAKANINDQEETTWALWALSHFVGPDAHWTNKNGEAWSIERLVRLQIEEEPTQAACGGTHGLFALAYARNGYIHTERPLRGVWLEADMKVRRYVEMAKQLQNTDGSFSSNHFEGPGYQRDFSERLAAAGHILEFLMMALPQQRLNEEWVRRGVEQVASDLIENRRIPVKCGPLYHGLHGLVVYRERMEPPAVTLQEEIEEVTEDAEESTEEIVTEELTDDAAEEVVAEDETSTEESSVEVAEEDAASDNKAENSEDAKPAEKVRRTAEAISDQTEL